MKDKNEILFYPDDYVKDTYGLDTVLKTTVESPADIPYNGLTFARKRADGTMQSFFKTDTGLPFEQTLAQKILSDPNVKTGTRGGFAGGSFEAVVDYILPCRNPNSIIFSPTIHQPISDACNVDTVFAIEVLFSFDDGLVFPIVKEYKSGGSFSISAMDAMEELIDELHDISSPEEFSEFLSDCPNAYRDGYGWHIIVSSAEGVLETLDFAGYATDITELRRAVVSMRLVRLSETIK